jgi:hypothetical protein
LEAIPQNNADEVGMADDALEQPRETHALRGGGTEFRVVPGATDTEPARTEGQRAREAESRNQDAGAEDDSAADGGPKPPRFNGGTAEQRQAVTSAHQDARQLCASVLARLANDNRYKEWFGAHTAVRFAKVTDNYSRIASRMDATTFTYDLTLTGCDAGVFAYTHKGGTTIWLCQGFWNAPSTGEDSRPGTLVHEHSHASAGTDDLAYGSSNARQLATATPDKAIRNADNHEYYAEGL